MLNQRQELFCQNVFTGKSTGEAAKLAGYSEKTAYSIGPRLLKNVEVTERIVALQDAVSSGRISAKEKKLEILENIYTHEPLPDQITSIDRIRAVAEHNKMEGDYAPEKHAILGDIEITIVHKDKGG